MVTGYDTIVSPLLQDMAYGAWDLTRKPAALAPYTAAGTTLATGTGNVKAAWYEDIANPPRLGG
jgi:hypothetical protein